MRLQKILLGAVVVFAVLLNLSLALALDFELSDQGIGVTNSTGNLVDGGNITIEIWDSATGGTKLYNETFTSAINSGRWNVMLGQVETLTLEYGVKYYKEYSINGQDLDFTNNAGAPIERLEFYSPLGEITGTYINETTLVLTDAEIPDDITINTTSLTFGGMPICLLNGTNCIAVQNDSVWNLTGSNYLYNNSNILYFNETKVNATITDIVDTQIGAQDFSDFLNRSKDEAISGEYTFNNNVNINGNLSVVGSVVNLSVTNQFVNGSILPDLNTTFNVGSPSLMWNAMYASTFYGNLAWSYITGAPTTLSYFTNDLGLGNWSADQSNYYTSTQVDTIITSVGNWSADQSNYYNTTQTDTQIQNANTSMQNYVDGTFVRNGTDVYFVNLNVTGTTTLGTVTIEADTVVAGNITATTKIYSDDWTNVSITESQISDLAHTIADNSSWNESYADDLYVNVAGDTMTGNLNMNDNNITEVTALNFATTGCDDTTTEGVVCWHSTYKTLAIATGLGDFYSMGQRMGGVGKNVAGQTIYRGQVVYISGVSGEMPELSLADASNGSKILVPAVVAIDSCNNNAVCPITTYGYLTDYDTSSWALETKLYIREDGSGNLTDIIPEFPNYVYRMATVIKSHADSGIILILPTLDYGNGITMNTLGLIGDFVQTDYKIRSLEGHPAMNGKNVMCLEMNGTTGESVCHLILQPGGAEQASIWVRSGLFVPENLICLNNTNRTDAQCWATAGGFAWQIADFNTTNTEGADVGITGELEVVKSAYIQENLTVGEDMIVLGNLNITGTSYLGDIIISADNITIDNINPLTGNSINVYGNLTTAGYWINGLFNWTEDSSYLSFDGAVLSFNETYLNASIDDRDADTTYSHLTNFTNNLGIGNWSDDKPDYLDAGTLDSGYYNKTQVDELIPASLTYFFWDVNATVNTTYKIMNTTQNPTITYKNSTSLNNGDVIVYRLNENTNLTGLSAGNLYLHTTVNKTGGTKDLQIQGRLSKRLLNGTIVDIATTSPTAILANGVETVIHEFTYISQQSLDASDMLLWQLEAVVSGSGTSPNVTIKVGGTTKNGIDLPVTSTNLLLVESDPFWISDKPSYATITQINNNDTRIETKVDSIINFSGAYNDLTGKPTVLSNFTNDLNFTNSTNSSYLYISESVINFNETYLNNTISASDVWLNESGDYGSGNFIFGGNITLNGTGTNLVLGTATPYNTFDGANNLFASGFAEVRQGVWANSQLAGMAYSAHSSSFAIHSTNSASTTTLNGTTMTLCDFTGNPFNLSFVRKFIFTTDSIPLGSGATAEITEYVNSSCVIISMPSAGASPSPLFDCTAISYVTFKRPNYASLDNGVHYFDVGTQAESSIHVYHDNATSGSSSIHTYTEATEDNVDGIQIQVDSNDNGNINGLLVDFDANDIKSGNLNSMIKLTGRAQDSKGGALYGITVEQAGGIGSADYDAILVTPGIDPIEHISGTYEAPDFAFDYDGSIYTNISSALESTTNDSILFNTNSDYEYFGDVNKFEIIEVELNTSAGVTIVPIFEYSTGAGFNSFVPSDGTEGFSQDGLIRWKSSGIGSWAPESVNGTSAYWIRIQRTAGTITTPPIESQIRILTNSSNKYKWGEDGDLNVKSVIAENVTATTEMHLGDDDEFYFGDGNEAQMGWNSTGNYFYIRVN